MSTLKSSASASDDPHAPAGDPVEPLRQAAETRSLKAWVKAVDLAIYREIRNLAHQPDHVRQIRAYSSLGEYAALWFGIGAAGILLDRPNARRWARGVAAIAVAHVASSAIKATIRRKRPIIEDLPHLMATPTGLSFPSTHATCSFAAARAYGKLLPSEVLYLAAASMAFSRIYLGVHYPSDVAAGAALGIAVGSAGR